MILFGLILAGGAALYIQRLPAAWTFSPEPF